LNRFEASFTGIVNLPASGNPYGILGFYSSSFVLTYLLTQFTLP
jgi:hypothetical protein